jgi:glycosyltransferase involved in cell wall biosynthesis
VIVVSDGSTDDTRQVVESYQGRSKNIRFIEQANLGPSVARNLGITSAVNDVIVFLDDDVEPIPEFLERHRDWHAKGSSYAVIGPMLPDPALKRTEPVWINWEHNKLQRVYTMFQEGGAYPDGKGGAHHFYSGNASIYRKWLVKSGGFDTRYKRQEDVELASRLEKSFGIQFQFEFQAVGIHRPSRSFTSWLKIPREYGKLDAWRLCEGTASLEEIQHNFDNRHFLTKMANSIVRIGPIGAIMVNNVLKLSVLSATRLNMRRAAEMLLSGLYSTAYYEAFLAERAALDGKAKTPDVGSPSSTGSALL